MAKKQTRRSISIKGLSAQRLENLAEQLHEEGEITIKAAPGFSTALEWLIAEECKRRGIPEETTLRPPPPRKGAKPGPKPDQAGGIFSF